MKKISERIKEGLALREMKQADLVNISGISKGALSSYISGTYEPKQRNIYKIAKALNVNEAWLMGYDVPLERTENSINSSEINLSTEEKQHIEDLRKLNDLGKDKVFSYTKDLLEMSKYSLDTEFAATLIENQKTPYLVACHDDNLTDEEKALMNEKINEALKNFK
ncbi:helix-turn-helix domain-containing protein [Clostridium perfringens]